MIFAITQFIAMHLAFATIVCPRTRVLAYTHHTPLLNNFNCFPKRTHVSFHLVSLHFARCASEISFASPNSKCGKIYRHKKIFGEMSHSFLGSSRPCSATPNSDFCRVHTTSRALNSRRNTEIGLHNQSSRSLPLNFVLCLSCASCFSVQMIVIKI